MLAKREKTCATLREEAVDLAVFLGPAASDIPFVELNDFNVNVVSASASIDVLKRVADRNYRFLVQPDSSCPYSVGLGKFVEQKFPNINVDAIKDRTIVSSSEHMTAILIRQLDGIGILSQDVAAKSDLTILPDFEVLLPVNVAVNMVKFEGVVGKRLRSLGRMPV